MTLERKNFRAHLGLSDIDAEQSEQAKRAMSALLPAVPPYQNGEDSSVGSRRFQQSDNCLEWRLAKAINTAIHFIDYAHPEQAAKVLRDAREDYLRMRK